ncbi:MAG TPA: alanyl-tRNA editing protein [Longimicrobiales bacterium]|nr:alanyl-tRNA editing protein [Longimicrobiales bacterium]
MPHIPAYERDSRLTRLETEVVATGEDQGRPFVVLADTVLYPEGGGQPPDHGTVGGVAVVDVQKAEGGIRHYLAGAPPSGRVAVELDWVRRFDHMQQHTGQHLLTAVADVRFGWHTVAFHLGDRISDIELDTPGITAARFVELEDAVAAEIRAARPVTARRVSPEEYARLEVRSRGLPEGHTGDIRLVDIAGIDLNTCGGTHLGSTAEMEALKLLGTESVRGGTRLFYATGVRLRRILAAHHERNAELRGLLGTSDEELVARVGAKLEQLKDAERAARDLEEELAAVTAEALAARPGAVLTAHWPQRGLPFLQRVAREAVRLAPDRVVFLTSGEGEEGSFLLAAGEQAALDVPEVGRRVAELLGGRGGGSGRVFQGKASRLSRREEAATLLGSGA